jgi:hypothetical protein
MEVVMIAGSLALSVAALFTGAALYINLVEQPARLGLDDRALLKEWKPAYQRGFAMQGSIALLGFLLGVWAFYASEDWRWLAGGLIMLANWPYTLGFIMPTNNKLMATPVEAAGTVTTALIRKWNALHAVRTFLGAAATAIFVWALN